ncbi:trypsin-like serine peptidase [Fructobacillus durionis]|uniref:Serine protease n=1 Tax=Fructobacillus durionis TaxID=283737 RepID=A0A1I1FCM6_9LACO|nr:trypsin-like peptidase domain-containing protein [Fructobacillus durionis]SFB97219.1 V8-like Glu-specific endopeptidase [Fructobacillus durionis]
MNKIIKRSVLQAGIIAIAMAGTTVTVAPAADAYVFDAVKFQKGLVPDTRQAPFSAVVFLLNTETGESGSGVLIGPDTVLTAAHVVLEDRENARPEDWPTRMVNPNNLSVRPAYGGATGATAERYPFGHHYRGAAISIPPQYFRTALQPQAPGADPGDYDFAIIHLNRPVRDAEPLALGELRQADARRELISVASFPGALGPGHDGEPENSNDNMYVDSGHADSISDHQIMTTSVNWSHGSSGGPVLNQQNQVVDVVSSSNAHGNFASRIDANMNCWIQEAMADVSLMLTNENVRGRWVDFGKEKVYFDDSGAATEAMALEPSNLGVLDLSIPGTSGNGSKGHDEL